MNNDECCRLLNIKCYGSFAVISILCEEKFDLSRKISSLELNDTFDVKLIPSGAIGLFRVVSSLCFKARRSAKP